MWLSDCFRFSLLRSLLQFCASLQPDKPWVSSLRCIQEWILKHRNFSKNRSPLMLIQDIFHEGGRTIPCRNILKTLAGRSKICSSRMIIFVRMFIYHKIFLQSNSKVVSFCLFFIWDDLICQIGGLFLFWLYLLIYWIFFWSLFFLSFRNFLHRFLLLNFIVFFLYFFLWFIIMQF